MSYQRDRSRTWVEVSRSNLLYNLEQVRARVPAQAKLCAVVKADAYGHGAEFVARLAEDQNLASYFAVANLDEAERLRSAGVKSPILIMSHVPVEELPSLVKLQIRPSISSLAEAKRFSAVACQYGRKLTYHLKLDTGMARLGLSCRERDLAVTLEEIGQIYDLPGLEAEGIFSHFASAGSDPAYQEKQFYRFQNTLKILEDRGIKFPISHIANSTTIIHHPEMALDMVRAGIVLYGCYESSSDAKFLDLKPVMHYKSKISEIRELEAGETVGYGRSWTAKRKSIIAVVEAGYSDGLLRSLSNRGIVAIRGQRFPIVGKVCMDRSMVDVTELPDPQIGEIAHLFGGPEPNYISADEQAELAGTISYELFCDVNRRVPRIYID